MYAHGLVFILVLFVVGAWYYIGAVRIFRVKGIDPTLLTYLSPLRYKKFWVSRCWIVCTFVLLHLYFPVGIVCVSTLFAFAFCHILLLLIFERASTQPVVYYIITLVICIISLSPKPLFLVIVLLLVTAQEFLLRRWITTNHARYNKWVAQNTYKINRTYDRLAKTMPAGEWFYILHIAVTENIARPKIVRYCERVYFIIKHPATISTGIMQIQASKPLTDEDSMAEGARIVRSLLRKMPKEFANPKTKLTWIAKHYNGSSTYSKYLFETYPGVSMAWQEINPVYLIAKSDR